MVSKSPHLQCFLVPMSKYYRFYETFTVFVKLLHCFYWFHNIFSLFFSVKTRVFGLLLGRSEVSRETVVKWWNSFICFWLKNETDCGFIILTGSKNYETVLIRSGKKWNWRPRRQFYFFPTEAGRIHSFSYFNS